MSSKDSLTPLNTGFDPYQDPALYERILTDELGDLPHYLALAQAARGPVLELACGTGRLTLPLAKSGIPITGLDLNEPMLRLARQRAQEAGLRVDWVQGDMRSFDLKRRFKLIILAYNALQHMETLEDITAVLTNIHRHLEHDGIFALDVHNPRMDLLARDPVERYFVEPSPYASPDEQVQWEQVAYDSVTQVNHIEWTLPRPEGEPKVLRLRLRQFFPQELQALLHYNGFKVLELAGDFGQSPLMHGHVKQVLKCALLPETSPENSR